MKRTANTVLAIAKAIIVLNTLAAPVTGLATPPASALIRKSH